MSDANTEYLKTLDDDELVNELRGAASDYAHSLSKTDSLRDDQARAEIVRRLAGLRAIVNRVTDMQEAHNDGRECFCPTCSIDTATVEPWSVRPVEVTK